MKLMITAEKPLLESTIDRRFGRSPWLIRFDTETNHWEALENPGASQSGGAGVAAAQFVVDQKVDVVISGDFGPHAVKALGAAKIEMRLFGNEVTTVQHALQLYARDELALFQAGGR